MSLMGKLFGGKGDDDKRKARPGSQSRRAQAKQPSPARPGSSGAIPKVNPASPAGGRSASGAAIPRATSVAKRPRAPSTTVARAKPGSGGVLTAGGGVRPASAAEDSSVHRRRISMKSKQIGQLLRKKEVVSDDQLNKALDIQQQQGGLLGQILVKIDACKKADIGAALKKQRTITSVPLDRLEFEQDALDLLDRDFCEKNRLIPFEKIGNNLCVAMANVLDAQAKNDLRDRTQLQAKPFDAGWNEIREAIEKHYAAGTAKAAPAKAPAADEKKKTTAPEPVATIEESDDLVIELPEEELEDDLFEGASALPTVGSAEGPVKALHKDEADDEPDDLVEDIEAVGIQPLERRRHEAETVNAPVVRPGAAPAPQPAAAPEPAEEALTFDDVDIIEADDLDTLGIEEIDAAGEPLGPELPRTPLTAIPLSRGYFSEVVQWGAADSERRWLAEHLADNVLPALPCPEAEAKAG